MKIAVTGASGFIGKHVLTELLRHGDEVCAVTRDISRLSEWQDKIQILECDLANPSPALYEQMGRPDVLMHLAWEGLPNYRSLHHYEIELPRHYQFLKNLTQAGLPALLITGTCFEYGAQCGRLSEDLPAMPDNPYGFAKDALRRQLSFLRGSFPFEFTWARLFYMYGSGQAKGSLYPALAQAVESGQKQFNMSGGQQLRDYLPVEIVARYLVILSKFHRDSGVINICSGKPVTIRSLVESWIRDNSWDISPNYGYYPYPDYEPMEFWGDDSRLRMVIGAVPGGN
jgi:dTDP-6-deoxy-L-talose 4-dehydrogenase (NAD+)